MSKKRVTSKDVAKLAGVSRSTVSFVLNDVKGMKISNDTRIKVKGAADELGYVPDAAAQALASRRSRIIGLILTRKPHHIASDAFITQILDGVLEIVHKNDLRLLVDIVEPEHQEEAYTEMVRAKRIDGILLSGPRFDDDALMVLGEEGFPTVLIGQLPGPTFYSVDVDNFSAAVFYHVVGHMIRQMGWPHQVGRNGFFPAALPVLKRGFGDGMIYIDPGIVDQHIDFTHFANRCLCHSADGRCIG